MTTEEKKKPVKTWPVIRAYWHAVTKYPVLLWTLVISAVLLEVTNILAPLVMREFINRVSSSTPSLAVATSLLTVIGLYGLVIFSSWAVQRVRIYCLTRVELKVMRDLFNSSFTYLMGHSYDYFISNFSGSLSRRVSRFAYSFENIVDMIIFNFFSTFLFAVGVITVLWMNNAVLGAGLLIWTLFFVWLQIHMSKQLQTLRVTKSEVDTKLTGTFSDSISNHPTVSLFSARPHEESLIKNMVQIWYDATLKTWARENWNYTFQGLFVILVQVGLFVGGIYLWALHYITVGDFVLIQVYIIGLIDRVWGIGNGMRRLYESIADAHEMVVILEEPHAVQDIPAAQPLVVSEGAISFEDVGFNFNETRQILKDFTLTIPGGQKVAFVGPSGAGKSTITKLLLRLYDVTSGEVSVDGQNIQKVTQDSLREAISFVPQEPILFHRSLMDNIRYGSRDATDDEVIEAARKAHCHEFIANLKDGYETHVGERGVKLSGGERQRVAIARAILKNAPILVLDEATSSLDSESEALIQDALRVLMEGKTVVVIAHRLSTIMTMDRIVVIEGGRVAASGTHDELLADESGLYHKLWSIQAGGFIADEDADEEKVEKADGE